MSKVTVSVKPNPRVTVGVNVPKDATAQLNGVTVGTIPSGGQQSFPVVQNGLPVGTWNGTEWVVPPCADADWTLEDTNGNTLDSGSIGSGDSDTIVAPNAAVGINGDAGLFSVPSGGAVNVMVEQDGSPVGAFDPITNSWVIPPCPPSGVSLSVAVSDTDPNIGDTVTITATPSSGFVPTEYLFFAFDGADMVHIPTANIDDSTATWTVSLAGNVGLYVLATDGVTETWGVVNITATAACNDPDALAYIAGVEAGDGEALEFNVRIAICSFVTGCKLDGNWDAIKASCILAGARTLAGALVPLAGPAPNSFNFVSADYDRKTGLKGNAANKYIDTLRANNADGQNDNHNVVFLTEAGTGLSGYMEGDTISGDGGNGILRLTAGTSIRFRSRRNGDWFDATGFQNSTGFMGMSRDNSASFNVRIGGNSFTGTVASQSPNTPNIFVFRRNNNPSPGWSNARIAFYSIGSAVDLPLLDARVTTLMNDLNAAIP